MEGIASNSLDEDGFDMGEAPEGEVVPEGVVGIIDSERGNIVSLGTPLLSDVMPSVTVGGARVPPKVTKTYSKKPLVTATLLFCPPI